MSHGKHQDEQDVVPDFVDHAVVADPDPERVESCQLDGSCRARVGRERENPRPETRLNRRGELPDLSGCVGRELDPVTVQRPSSLKRASADTDPRPARAFWTSAASAGVGLTDFILRGSNVFRSSIGTSAATAFRPDRTITRSPFATRDKIDSSR